jgi:hypothetical protein
MGLSQASVLNAQNPEHYLTGFISSYIACHASFSLYASQAVSKHAMCCMVAFMM